MIHKFLIRKLRHRYAGLFMADGLFFGLTNPQKVAAPWLIIGFLLMVLSFYCFVGACLRVIRQYGFIAGRSAPRLARLLAGATALLIALQSTGELSSKDILILLPLSCIGYFYASRGLKRPQTG